MALGGPDGPGGPCGPGGLLRGEGSLVSGPTCQGVLGLVLIYFLYFLTPL